MWSFFRSSDWTTTRTSPFFGEDDVICSILLYSEDLFHAWMEHFKVACAWYQSVDGSHPGGATGHTGFHEALDVWCAQMPAVHYQLISPVSLKEVPA